MSPDIALPKSWRSWLLPERPSGDAAGMVRPGLYHFHQERHGQHVRYHLRVDEGGPAILIAAASDAVLLSPWGATIAKSLLEGRTPAEIHRRLGSQVSPLAVADVADTLENLGSSNVRYPIFNLVDPKLAELPWELNAPFQADLEVGLVDSALELIDRLWEIRVPHARLLVTPRSDRSGLVQAVRHAEEIGMIAGVRVTSARWLTPETITRLANVGLDYVVLPWGVTADQHDILFGKGDHDLLRLAVAKIRAAEMTPVLTAALRPPDCRALESGLEALNQMGVHHLEVFPLAEYDRMGRGSYPISPQHHGDEGWEEGSDRGFHRHELRQTAAWLEDLADSRRMQIVWLPPHARLASESWHDVVRRGPRAGGDVSVRIRANGDVIPPRGPLRAAGNLLLDVWAAIWHDAEFRRFRGSTRRATRCQECPGMAICAADCPSEPIAWVLP